MDTLSIWSEKKNFSKIALNRLLTLPDYSTGLELLISSGIIDLQNNRVCKQFKHWKYRISVPMLYIVFCVPQIGVGGPKYFSVPQIGFGVKKNYKAKNEYVFIFYRRGTNNNNNNNNTNGRFPEGVRKEEIQQWRRTACAKELRRPTTWCCGKYENMKT